MEGQKETYPASNQQANRVRRSAELSGLIFCISNGKAAVSPSAGVTGYQSQARPRPPGGKHSLLCAHQRSSSPLTQSMMGFKIQKKGKSHFPSALLNPDAPSRQTHQHQHVSAGFVSKKRAGLILNPRGSNAAQPGHMWLNNFSSPGLAARRQQLTAATTARLNGGRWKVFSAVLRTRFVNLSAANNRGCFGITTARLKCFEMR